MNTTTKPGVMAVMDALAEAVDIRKPGTVTLLRQQKEARATVERTGDALADAVDWIASMRCDDAITHPRLKVLRAALAAYRGEA